MGQARSRPFTPAPPTDAPAFVCHYELLRVAQDATPEDIKRAYRQQALLLHPDKNMHRVAEATALFARVQNAYQVLSDPHERAFYDRHRDAIHRKHRAHAHAHSHTHAYTLDDLMPFFDASAFTGFTDAPGAFFAVYRELFALLEELEADAAADAGRPISGSPPRTAQPPPHTSFGALHTPFEPSLRVFYDKFLHFSSARAFYEADAHDDTCAENRRHRRAIDRENQRLRDARRRDFNDTVRSLAAWVRKRDPRYRAHLRDRDAAKQRALQAQRAALASRRAALAAAYVAPGWDDSAALDDAFLRKQLQHLGLSSDDEYEYEDLDVDVAVGMDVGEGESEGEGDADANANADTSPAASAIKSEDFEDTEFYCTLCRKLFKTAMQWRNHEQSKKHRASMLKAGFVDTEPDADVDLSTAEEHHAAPPEPPPITTTSTVVDREMGKQKPPKKKTRQKATTATKAATPKAPKEPSKKAAADNALACKVCRAILPSRNALFRHIHEQGHAALK